MTMNVCSSLNSRGRCCTESASPAEGVDFRFDFQLQRSPGIQNGGKDWEGLLIYRWTEYGRICVCCPSWRVEDRLLKWKPQTGSERNGWPEEKLCVTFSGKKTSVFLVVIDNKSEQVCFKFFILWACARCSVSPVQIVWGCGKVVTGLVYSPAASFAAAGLPSTLVSLKLGPPSESLITNTAAVTFLTAVNSHVLNQRLTPIETCVTNWADKRIHSSVGSCMFLHTSFFWESFTANGASERFLSSVRSLVLNQRVTTIETCVTNGAGIWFLSCVNSYMSLQIPPETKCFAAFGALGCCFFPGG